MHATVFVGIVLGVVGLFVLFRRTQTEAGPFPPQVTSADGGAAGAVAVTFERHERGPGQRAGRLPLHPRRRAAPG